MKTYVLIADGLVVNRALFDDAGLPEGWPDAASWIESETAQIGWRYQNGEFIAPPRPPDPPAPPPSFLARDLFAQLSVADYSAIKTAVAANDALGLLWDSLKAQGDAPIRSDAAQFQQGWTGLTQALGAKRAGEIAAALGIPNT